MSRPSPHYAGCIPFHEVKRRLDSELEESVTKADVLRKFIRKAPKVHTLTPGLKKPWSSTKNWSSRP